MAHVIRKMATSTVRSTTSTVSDVSSGYLDVYVPEAAEPMLPKNSFPPKEPPPDYSPAPSTRTPRTLRQAETIVTVDQNSGLVQVKVKSGAVDSDESRLPMLETSCESCGNRNLKNLVVATDHRRDQGRCRRLNKREKCLLTTVVIALVVTLCMVGLVLYFVVFKKES